MTKIKTYISNAKDWDLKNNEENKKKLSIKLWIPRDKFIYIKTEHWNNIYEVWKEKPELFDWIITQNLETPICAYSADCLGIFFYDEVNKVIWIIHAGRVWTEKEIAKNMVKKFLKKWSKLENIKIIFSPSIFAINYEVDLDCWKKFHKESKKIISKEKQLLDIPLENILQLKEVWISEKNILKSEINTYNSKDYFSHRKWDKERFWNYIWIEK